MYGYKHYIRIDANNTVIHRFSDAFETPLEADICVATDAGRHYNDPYTNERGQFIYQWDGTDQVLRSQAELDVEYATRPPEPKTELELLREENDSLKSAQADILFAMVTNNLM